MLGISRIILSLRSKVTFRVSSCSVYTWLQGSHKFYAVIPGSAAEECSCRTGHGICTQTGDCIINSEALPLNVWSSAEAMEKSDERTEVVLLSTGSFNPITTMHLRMFELARDHLHDTGKYKVINGIISPVGDGYKKKGLIEASHRLAMANLAASCSGWVTVDPWECTQKEWVETALVLRHHQQKLACAEGGVSPEKRVANRKSNKRKRVDGCQDVPDHKCPDSRAVPQLMLLCGGDTLESLGTPNLWKPEHVVEIVSQFGLICITRVASDPRKFIYESDVLWRYKHNIHLVEEWITNDIASTKIRRALRRGMNVRYLLPDPVVEYIQKYDLYNDESEQKNAGLVLEPLVRNTQNLQKQH